MADAKYLREHGSPADREAREQLLERFKEYLGREWAGLYEMVAEFNDHFGVPRAHVLANPSLSIEECDHRLPYDFQTLKLRHLKEELDEYKDAVEAGDMEKAFDALIDLVYVALGAAHAHRFKYDEGFKRVHEANMRKQRALKNSDSKRGSKYDVIKPDGWKPASLADLL